MFPKSSRPALVCRTPGGALARDQYLQVSDQGLFLWTDAIEAATAFESMREATRAALRLPGSFRAFGLPLPSNADVGRTIH